MKSDRITLLVSLLLLAGIILTNQIFADGPTLGLRKGMFLSTIYELTNKDLQTAAPNVYITHSMPEKLPFCEEYMLGIMPEMGLYFIMTKTDVISKNSHDEVLNKLHELYNEPNHITLGMAEGGIILERVSWAAESDSSLIHYKYSLHSVEVVTMWSPSGEECMMIIDLRFTQPEQSSQPKFKVDPGESQLYL